MRNLSLVFEPLSSYVSFVHLMRLMRLISYLLFVHLTRLRRFSSYLKVGGALPDWVLAVRVVSAAY